MDAVVCRAAAFRNSRNPTKVRNVLSIFAFYFVLFMCVCSCRASRRLVGVAVALLEGGADSEQEDREDLTALHWAARMGKDRMTRALLDHHADVEVGVCI